MDIQEIQKITSKDLYHNDILVITVDTGKMPPQRARQYMDRVKEQIEETIGTDYRVLVKPPSMHIDIINTPMDISHTNTKEYLAGMHTDNEVRDVFGLVGDPIGLRSSQVPGLQTGFNDPRDLFSDDADDTDDFERAKPIE